MKPQVDAEVSDAALVMSPGADPKDAESDSASSRDADATVMMPKAVLITHIEGVEPTKHVLGAVSSIGRGEDNQIVLPEGGVSTNHVMLTASLSGFRLKDLKSRNGTFANDKRITECAVSDGDRICLGDVELIFRSA